MKSPHNSFSFIDFIPMLAFRSFHLNPPRTRRYCWNFQQYCIHNNLHYYLEIENDIRQSTTIWILWYIRIQQIPRNLFEIACFVFLVALTCWSISNLKYFYTFGNCGFEVGDYSIPTYHGLICANCCLSNAIILEFTDKFTIWCFEMVLFNFICMIGMSFGENPTWTRNG